MVCLSVFQKKVMFCQQGETNRGNCFSKRKRPTPKGRPKGRIGQENKFRSGGREEWRSDIPGPPGRETGRDATGIQGRILHENSPEAAFEESPEGSGERRAAAPPVRSIRTGFRPCRTSLQQERLRQLPVRPGRPPGRPSRRSRRAQRSLSERRPDLRRKRQPLQRSC